MDEKNNNIKNQNVQTKYLPIVVINVIEYKNADAYVHLCGFIDGWLPVC